MRRTVAGFPGEFRTRGIHSGVVSIMNPPWPVASHLRTVRFTPVLKVRSTPSQACCLASSARIRSGLTVSIPAQSRRKAATAAALLGLISRRPPSCKPRSAGSANPAKLRPSRFSSRRKTPPGLPASDFLLAVAFADPQATVANLVRDVHLTNICAGDGREFSTWNLTVGCALTNGLARVSLNCK